jgi:uncharacterized protein YfdQ (DUF2303 family)
MSGWFSKVREDLANLVDAIAYYEAELNSARYETAIKGNLEKLSQEIPGFVSYRFAQLQEVEAILEYLNIELRRIHREKYRKYLEHYNKTLSSRDADKFAEGEPECVAMEHLINEFALVRNRYLALMKGLDAKQYQLNNLTRLRVAGMDDVNLS